MDWLIPEWLVALSLTLFIVDIFLMTEILSWGGVIALACWLTWRIDAPLKWSVLIFIGSFICFAFMYVCLLRTTIGTMVRRLMQGRAPDETLYAIVGKTGLVRVIDGRVFANVESELWPVANSDESIVDGVKVKVTAIRGGEILVSCI